MCLGTFYLMPYVMTGFFLYGLGFANSYTSSIFYLITFIVESLFLCKSSFIVTHLWYILSCASHYNRFLPMYVEFYLAHMPWIYFTLCIS